MACLTLTDRITNEPVVVNTNAIIDVRDYPRGECWIDLNGGAVLQVTEDTDEVRRMWLEATK